MKVELREISETRRQMVVSFDAAEVDAELAKVTSEFVRHARVPGFRPGRAPLALVKKRFEKEIAQESRQAIVSRAYRDGVKEAGVEVLRVIEVPEPALSAGQPAEIMLDVEIHPKFELPAYKGLPVQPGELEVAEAEIDEVVESLRRERAEFSTVDRPAEAGDYVKFGFEGMIGDQKIADLVTDRPIYGTMPQTWEEAGAEEGLLPGMGRHLVGMGTGDKKQVDIHFPGGFAVSQLAGKQGTYSIAVQEVRKRVLPEVDEAFLKAQKVGSVEELRSRIKDSLAQRKAADDRSSRRRQVADALAAKVEFPIPESLIESETDALLRQLVEQNVRRGVPQDELEKNKEELYAGARKAAIERTKVRMVLERVAEAEKITAERGDIERALVREAMRSGERPEKLVKELEKDRGRLQALQHGVLVDKALDFLVEHATVQRS